MEHRKESVLIQCKGKYFIGQIKNNLYFTFKKQIKADFFSISKLYLKKFFLGGRFMLGPQGAFCTGQKNKMSFFFLTSMYILNYTNKQHISCEVRLHCKRLLQLKENTSCLHSVKMDYHLSCYLPYTIQGTLAVLTRITVPICSFILVCMLPTI